MRAQKTPSRYTSSHVFACVLIEGVSGGGCLAVHGRSGKLVLVTTQSGANMALMCQHGLKASVGRFTKADVGHAATALASCPRPAGSSSHRCQQQWAVPACSSSGRRFDTVKVMVSISLLLRRAGCRDSRNLYCRLMLLLCRLRATPR